MAGTHPYRPHALQGCLLSDTHTPPHPTHVEAQQHCQNQAQEENKELYMTKDRTSIFFRADFFLPVGGG